MKKLSVLFALLAVAMMANAADLVVSARPLTIKAGETAVLDLRANSGANVKVYAAFQMDIDLPAGLTFATEKVAVDWEEVLDENGDPVEDENGEPVMNPIAWEDQVMKPSVGAADGHTISFSTNEELTHMRIVCYSGENKMFKSSSLLVKVTVKASETLTIGEHADEITISDMVFATSGGGESGVADGFKPADFKVSFTVESAAIDIDLKITAAKYSTLILPFDADLPEGLTASTVDWPESGNELVETPVTDGKLVAGVPYLMYGEEVKTYTFTGIPTYKLETGEKDALVGVLAKSTVPAGCYVLQNHDGVVGFYKVATEREFYANRCYLTAKAAGALMYRIGGTTNIEEVTVDENADVYDVLGRKVIGPLQKGVYIKNGRKIYVK